MPSVNRQSIFLILAEHKTVIRGQAQTFLLKLHREYIGNLIDLNLVDNVEFKIFDSAGVQVKAGSRKTGSVTVGVGANIGQMQFDITGAETLNLPSGDIKVEVIVTDATGLNFEKRTILPKLKLGTITNAGETLPDGSIAGRFVSPSIIYKIK